MALQPTAVGGSLTLAPPSTDVPGEVLPPVLTTEMQRALEREWSADFPTHINMAGFVHVLSGDAGSVSLSRPFISFDFRGPNSLDTLERSCGPIARTVQAFDVASVVLMTVRVALDAQGIEGPTLDLFSRVAEELQPYLPQYAENVAGLPSAVTIVVTAPGDAANVSEVRAEWTTKTRKFELRSRAEGVTVDKVWQTLIQVTQNLRAAAGGA